jgi:hypothetical protein
MPSNEEVYALALSNKAAIDSIQSGTVTPDNFSAIQIRLLIENIFPEGVAININDPNGKVGDQVFGKKAGINGGGFVFGTLNTFPATTDAHLDDIIAF